MINYYNNIDLRGYRATQDTGGLDSQQSITFFVI